MQTASQCHVRLNLTRHFCLYNLVASAVSLLQNVEFQNAVDYGTYRPTRAKYCETAYEQAEIRRMEEPNTVAQT